MKRRIIYLTVFILLLCSKVNAQTKVVGECTIQYSIYQPLLSDTTVIGMKSVMVKGNQCKTVLTTPQLTQTLLFNVQESKATIIKEIGTARFLQEIVYPPANTPTLLSMKEVHTDTTVILLGYPCKQIQLKWSDGTIYELLYTNEISPTVSAFELAFKEVPGLVLSSTVIPESGNQIQYLATKLDLSPISLSQFNVNTSLYQIID